MKTPYGDRIKAFATVSAIFWALFALVGAIACFVAAGESYYYDDLPYVWVGLGILFFGAFAAWGSYALISGFGELVENSEMITAHLGLKSNVDNEDDEAQNQDQALEKTLKDNNLVYVKYISNGKCSKCGKIGEVEQYQDKNTYEFTYYCEDCLKEM